MTQKVKILHIHKSNHVKTQIKQGYKKLNFSETNAPILMKF